MIPKVTRRGKDTEEFARYEFKYLLTSKEREVIEDEISHFMTFDGHAHEALENSYFVRSLYFENADGSNYYEKIDGVGVRRKFRIRTYERQYSEGLPIYLELKGRKNERTYKLRTKIEEEHIQLFTNPQAHDTLIKEFDGHPLIEQFVYESHRKRVEPKVLVDYIRRPYTSDFDLNFRVTFDNRLSAAAANQLFVKGNQNWRNCLPGYTIIEIKFHRKIPAWFHRILQVNDMRRLSISKFCKGMEACDLAVDLS